MRTYLTSASKLPLLAHCGFSARRDIEIPYRAPGIDSMLGNAGHWVSQQIIGVIRPTTWVNLDENAFLTLALEKHKLNPADWLMKLKSMRMIQHAQDVVRAHPAARAEVAYAWDTRTGEARELGTDIGRDYGKAGARGWDVVGSCDVVWIEQCPITGERITVIRDWKTGRATHVEMAHENKQLRFLLACAMQVNDTTRGRVELAFVPPGDIIIEDHEFDALDLCEVGGELEELSVSIPNAQPCPGNHCTQLFCAAVGVCPATQEALAEVMPAEDPGQKYPLVIRSADDIVNMPHALSVYQRLRAANVALAGVKDVLEEYARRHNGIELGNNTVWGPKIIAKETVSAPSASALADVIRAHCPQAAGLVKATVGKTALESAVKAHAPPRQGKKTCDAILDAIRRLGWTIDDAYEQFTEHKR